MICLVVLPITLLIALIICAYVFLRDLEQVARELERSDEQ